MLRVTALSGVVGIQYWKVRKEEKEIRVNLFIPSVLTWHEGGVELVQRNRLPDSDRVELTMNLKKKQRLILWIRKPDWADKATLIINGKAEQLLLGNDGYWMIDKVWNRKRTCPQPFGGR